MLHVVTALLEYPNLVWIFFLGGGGTSPNLLKCTPDDDYSGLSTIYCTVGAIKKFTICLVLITVKSL